jgi:hypothetical protein
MMKPVDIYIERASTHCNINTVELDRETGLYTPNVVYIGMGGIRRAQKIRKKRIAEWKSKGLVVKGCNNLISVRDELFESLYKPGYTIQDKNEMFKMNDDGCLFYVGVSLQTEREFQQMPLLFLYSQIELGKVQLAIRVSDVKA